MRILPAALVVVVLAAALPVGGQEGNAAAELFRKMEAKLLGAKTLNGSVAVVMRTPQEVKLVGALHLADKDRANLALTTTVAGKDRRGTMLSDGKRMRWAVEGTPAPTQATPPGLNGFLAAKCARAGIGFSFLIATGGDGDRAAVKDIEKMYPVSDFHLRAKEQVGDRTAQVVEHRLTWAGKEPVLRVAVWIDAKTDLPLKRLLVGSKGNFTIRIEETYTDLALDGKLDGKRFALPE